MGMAERARASWERVAPDYDTATAGLERRFLAPSRPWVCGRASGEVLEVAIGTGANLPYYADGVRLTGLDADPTMLDAARRKAREGGCDATLVEGDALALPFGDASFDAVVCTFALCGVPDERAALLEMVRVLRPGGDLLLADHVAASNPVVLALEHAVTAVTARSHGEYFTRRPRLVVDALGLPVVASRRRTFGALEEVHARTPARGAAAA